MSVALGIVAVFVLTFGTGYFVAQEFSYVSANRVELSRQAAAGDKDAASAIPVMERLSFMLSAAQVGITATGLLVGFIAQPGVGEVSARYCGGRGLGGAACPRLVRRARLLAGHRDPDGAGRTVPEEPRAGEAGTSSPMALSPSTHVYLAVTWPDGEGVRQLGQLAAA